MNNDIDFAVSETLAEITRLSEKTGAVPGEIGILYILEKIRQMEAELKTLEKLIGIMGC